MFNKNGSNNSNGSANGVHKDTAVVARNGNGHKPDAAIPAEHDLLWDGLSPAVTQALGQPIDPAIVSQRKGRGGRSFDYLEGHIVIAQANRIFGYGGWGYELVGDVTLRRIETVNPQTGEVKVEQGYSAPVRVSVAGALPRTDVGVHPGGGGQLRRARHCHQGRGHGRTEAGVPAASASSSATRSTATSRRSATSRNRNAFPPRPRATPARPRPTA